MTTDLNLSKMRSEFGFPVRYYLSANDTEIDMNALVGKHLSIEYLHTINCVSCGKITNRSYMSGGYRSSA